MALRILQPGIQPLGQFDGYDNDYLTILGGEVAQFGYVSTAANVDLATSDIGDGYVGVVNQVRPAVTTNLTAGVRPLFLTDDGTTNYGTLFGQVVGGIAGQVVNTGAQLGPHTATGSGKVTLWDKPGLYAVTLDAVDETAGTGLVPGNGTLVGNDALYATATGLLTPTVGAAFEAGVVARFVEFQTNGSLVTTPRYLTSALNSPPGAAAAQMLFTEAVIHFHPEL